MLGAFCRHFVKCCDVDLQKAQSGIIVDLGELDGLRLVLESKEFEVGRCKGYIRTRMAADPMAHSMLLPRFIDCGDLTYGPTAQILRDKELIESEWRQCERGGRGWFIPLAPLPAFPNASLSTPSTPSYRGWLVRAPGKGISDHAKRCMRLHSPDPNLMTGRQ